MRIKKMLIGLLAATAPVLAASPAAAPALAKAPAVATAEASATARPALWVLKDADTTIYLFGTFHALKQDIVWFDGKVKEAFDASDTLVLELPMPDPSQVQQIIMSKAVDADGPALTKKLNDKQREVYTAGLGKIGLPAAALEQYEPWFVAMTTAQVMLQKNGFSGDAGAESVLTKAAKASGKHLAGFETFAQQIDFFDTLPEADQIAFMMSGIEEAEKFDAILGEMLTYWKTGQDVKLAKLMNENMASSPRLYEVLIKNRNKAWASVIADMMKRPGTKFVAVGTGHLAGPDSVQALLAKRRLKAQRVAL